MCVFFYLLNLNVQTAWSVNKKIYNQTWIESAFRLFIQRNDAGKWHTTATCYLLSRADIRPLDHHFAYFFMTAYTQGGHAQIWRYSRIENRDHSTLYCKHVVVYTIFTKIHKKVFNSKGSRRLLKSHNSNLAVKRDYRWWQFLWASNTRYCRFVPQGDWQVGRHRQWWTLQLLSFLLG